MFLNQASQQEKLGSRSILPSSKSDLFSCLIPTSYFEIPIHCLARNTKSPLHRIPYSLLGRTSVVPSLQRTGWDTRSSLYCMSIHIHSLVRAKWQSPWIKHYSRLVRCFKAHAQPQVLCSRLTFGSINIANNYLPCVGEKRMGEGSSQVWSIT